MTADRHYLRLAPQVERGWPVDLFPLVDPAALDRIWIAATDVEIGPERVGFRTGMLFEEALEVGLPGLDAVSLSVGDPTLGADVDVEIEVDLYPTFAVRIGPVDLALHLRNDLLSPVERVDDGTGGSARFRPVEGARCSLTFAQIGAAFDLAGHVALAIDQAVSLPPVMVAATGVVVEAQRVTADLSGAAPGLTLDGVSLHLPEGLSVAVPTDVTVEDCVIGPRGLSGRFAGGWEPQLADGGSQFTGNGAGELFGIAFGLTDLALELVDSVPVAATIRGRLLVPYFAGVVNVEVHLGGNGELSVALAAEDGLTLTRPELLELTVLALGVDVAGGVGRLVVSGRLTPLLMAADGLVWPTLEVTDLEIDTRGMLRIREAWLDLGELATLDLWGFHFELTRIGIGSTAESSEDRLWLDLTGGVRLVEQIPMGLGVEGFRISWPLDLLAATAPPYSLEQLTEAVGRIEVRFAGLQLSYGIPDTVEFEGMIRFFKDAQAVGFAGDVALRVPAAGFAAEAGLLVGMALDPPPFPFLYLYVGVELPAGVPLAQSGLALKGAQGLFGLNVGPDRTPEQNWYEDWYKRGPIVGAHPTTKWRAERGAIALGVGVTITTADGVVKGTRGLLVLVLPGPVLIIEGRALLLDGLSPGEPPLRALAVLDGREHVVQVNVEAQAELVEDLLEATGTAEAFFDLDDITNWHLHLGRDEPRDRRVRANVLDLFPADAYLMLDMVGETSLRSRMGVSIGLEPPPITFGPVELELLATIEGAGTVATAPARLSSEVALDGTVRISAFEFGASLSVRADVLADGPAPMRVDAAVEVDVDLPWPLDPLHAELHFSWESPDLPVVDPPVAAVAMGSRFASGSTEIGPVDATVVATPAQWRAAAEGSPVVALDARPTVTFSKEMNAATDVPFARHPDGAKKSFAVGPLRFVPSVLSVRLFAHPKAEPWTDTEADWTHVASSIGAEIDGAVRPLPGVWLTESDPTAPGIPAARRLLLWSTNPVTEPAGTSGAGEGLFTMPGGRKAPADALLYDHPDLMTLDASDPVAVCFDVTAIAKPVRLEPGTAHVVDGGRFTCGPRAGEIRRDGSGPMLLHVDGDLAIEVPTPTGELSIRFAEPPDPADARRAVVQARRRARSLAELADARAAAAPLLSCRIAVDSEVSADGQTWTIHSTTPFDCVHLGRIGVRAVAGVCVLPGAAVDAAERARAQDAANALVPAVPADTMLEPGTYYRLEVASVVAVELELGSSPFADLLEQAYRAALDGIGYGDDPRAFTQVAYFRTDRPPARLAPYVAWTSPAHQAQRVFRRNDLAIRFVRPYLAAMFASPTDQLTAHLVDADGATVEVRPAAWGHSATGTRFPDEVSWEAHRAAHLPDWPADDAHDSLLVFPADPDAPPLAPGARYMVQVVGDGMVRLEQTFVTSRATDLADLVGSYRGTPVEAEATPDVDGLAASAVEWRTRAATHAAAVVALERGLVDHRLDALVGGVTRVDELVLDARAARVALDESFRAIATDLAPEIHHRPFGEHLELVVVRAAANDAPVALWLRAPESLDLRIDLPVGTAGPASSGRTTVTPSTDGAVVQARLVHDAACSQVILLPPGPTWPAGEHVLGFTYIRDLGDEAGLDEHRYDRPTEFSLGGSAPVSAEIRLTT